MATKKYTYVTVAPKKLKLISDTTENLREASWATTVNHDDADDHASFKTFADTNSIDYSDLIP